MLPIVATSWCMEYEVRLMLKVFRLTCEMYVAWLTRCDGVDKSCVMRSVSGYVVYRSVVDLVCRESGHRRMRYVCQRMSVPCDVVGGSVICDRA